SIAARLVALACLVLAVPSPPVALAIEGESYVVSRAEAAGFALATAERAVPLVVDPDDLPGVLRAAGDLQQDIERVTGRKPQLLNVPPRGGEVVLIGTLGKSALLDRLVADGKLNPAGVAGRWETYVLETIDQPLPGVDRALVIAGS